MLISLSSCLLSIYTVEMRSDDATPTIAGGVVGGLVGVVLIAVIVIVIIVIIVKNKKESSKYNGIRLSQCVCTVQLVNLLLFLQLVEEQPTIAMTYHVRTTWCTVCVR